MRMVGESFYEDDSSYGNVGIIFFSDGDVRITDINDDEVVISKGCAIAVAHAILKRYGEGLE